MKREIKQSFSSSRQRQGKSSLRKISDNFKGKLSLRPESISGFTLLEVIISVSIIIVITLVTVYGYIGFNDRLENASLAFEAALLLREAQISGVSVRENPDAESFEHAWGVYTKITGSASSDSRVVLFADSDDDETYDGDFNSCPSQECVSALDMRRNNVLEKVCRLENDGDFSCSPSSDLAGVSITFKRPKPDAIISFVDSSGDFLPEVSGTIGTIICIKSPLDRRTGVEVLETGEISIKKDSPECAS